MHKRVVARIVAAAGLAYVLAYGAYRATNTQVWEGDGQAYVIFGSSLTYYAFRPLSYIDGAVTGMHFHIGPHDAGQRETP